MRLPDTSFNPSVTQYQHPSPLKHHMFASSWSSYVGLVALLHIYTRFHIQKKNSKIETNETNIPQYLLLTESSSFLSK